MKITLDFLVILCDLYKYVPSRTPNRLDVILQLAQEIRDASKDEKGRRCKEVIIQLHDEKEIDSTDFELNLENLRRLSQNIPLLEDVSSGIVHAYHKILLPSSIFCCQKVLNIIDSHATIRVYTVNGSLLARSYHAKCRICKLLHYHGFSMNKESGLVMFDSGTDFEVLVFNSGSGYSKKILESTNNIICIGGVSFEKTADILNVNNGFEPPINPDRLESAWFVFRIIEIVKEFPWPRKNKSKELDLEQLCKQVFMNIKSVLDRRWVNHICNEVGCKERFVVIDGNEKLFRSICAAEKNRVMGNAGEVNSYDLCIRNPVRGNQYGSSSKFCSTHLNNKEGSTDIQVDLRPSTRSISSKIPKTVTTGEGCKEDGKVNRFYQRTAGMFYFFRPCGIRISNFEMYTAESLSAVFTYLIDLFGENPLPSQLKGIVYDRSCDLHPFMRRLHENGNTVASKYESLSFIVDIFHVEKHTQPKCVITSGQCEYHPHLEKFHDVRDMNTEVAEQSFKELNAFKCSTRKMTYAKRLLFLKLIDHTYNIRHLNRKKNKVKLF